ncbi:MAG TPA: ribosome maturation factor RimM [Candidatus Marinimicrobia bacterium]|nr:ribosome maturation factor RimM [Candidatus Neomarinimicrobiota bacterium]HRU92168.1 ribosome maturation factor RimM [Candidatus Neomarinimicrobiota bacterium]
MDHLVLLPVGSILKSFGLNGAVLLNRGSLKNIKVDEPKVLWLGESAQVARPWKVDYLRISTKKVYLKLRDINSRQEADYLKGLNVFIKQENERKSEFDDLVGYKVRVINSAKDIGFINSLDETNPQASFVIESEGASILVPAVSGLIERVDPDQKVVVFKNVEGLFPK